MSQTTLREIWKWMTSDAASDFRLIGLAPWDVPLSVYGHVLGAAIVYFVLCLIGLLFLFWCWEELKKPPKPAISEFGVKLDDRKDR